MYKVSKVSCLSISKVYLCIVLCYLLTCNQYRLHLKQINDVLQTKDCNNNNNNNSWLYYNELFCVIQIFLILWMCWFLRIVPNKAMYYVNWLG